MTEQLELKGMLFNHDYELFTDTKFYDIHKETKLEAINRILQIKDADKFNEESGLDLNVLKSDTNKIYLVKLITRTLPAGSTANYIGHKSTINGNELPGEIKEKDINGLKITRKVKFNISDFSKIYLQNPTNLGLLLFYYLIKDSLDIKINSIRMVTISNKNEKENTFDFNIEYK